MTLVTICNPKSGGGKAMRFALAQEAGHRGIEAVELRCPVNDLEALVRGRGARRADGLAMAGRATARRPSSPRSPPSSDCHMHASRPGTRNHFALDLGVDRDDVVGALDAFVDGGERRVDLGDVNGRVSSTTSRGRAELEVELHGDQDQRRPPLNAGRRR
jgi:hypothetical protein